VLGQPEAVYTAGLPAHVPPVALSVNGVLSSTLNTRTEVDVYYDVVGTKVSGHITVRVWKVSTWGPLEHRSADLTCSSFAKSTHPVARIYI
jgi:hypothetical protein